MNCTWGAHTEIKCVVVVLILKKSGRGGIRMQSFQFDQQNFDLQWAVCLVNATHLPIKGKHFQHLYIQWVRMWYQLEYVKLKHMDPNSQQIETVVMQMVCVERCSCHFKKILTCLQNCILTSTVSHKGTFIINKWPLQLYHYAVLKVWLSDGVNRFLLSVGNPAQNYIQS